MLCGGFSVNQFGVQLTDAITPVLVLAQFLFRYAAKSFSFQNIHLLVKKGRKFTTDMLRITHDSSVLAKNALAPV